MIAYIKNWIKALVIRRATAHKMIDIVEVRTKEIGLTSVKTETDIRIVNSFFLPITILSIKTDLLNRDGLKVGRMSYDIPQRIKGKSNEVLTTTSEISIITSLFQAISTLLSQHIKMKSVGVAQVRFLWWTFEIPVNDDFEIHPSKLKITQAETEEEREQRLKKESARKERYALESERRKAEREQKRAEWKEDILKKRYKDKYIPKEQRLALQEESLQVIEPATHLSVELDTVSLSEIESDINAATPPSQINETPQDIPTDDTVDNI